jgi:uncharacterized protein YycO
MTDTYLLPGDIICIGTDDTLFDWLIPGKWSHTVIYGGKTNANGYDTVTGLRIWNTEQGGWVCNDGWVIHSTQGGSAQASGKPSWDDDSGLRTSSFTYAVNDHAGNVIAMRVLKNGGAFMSSTERNNIVYFCTSKLYTNNDYDWNWLCMQEGVDSCWPAPAGYYCSELAWAAYKNQLGINLDGDWSPFDIGVSPEDLYWAENAQVIGLEMNSNPEGGGVPGGAYKVNPSSDLYKVTMRVYKIRYDTDYDPWPKGDGEMYLKCYIGEGYFPSCAETHQTGDTNWDRIEDAGDNWKSGVGNGDTVTWNAYHYALVSYDSYCKIRLVPMEEDSPDGDDSYPAFQWWWSPSQWHNYINNGWYWNGGLVDYGDYRLQIYFSIASCY